MAPSQICLQCGMQDKDKDHQFCSAFCTNIAASRAPELLPVPSNHAMYQNVKEQFRKQWEAGSNPPKIKAMFLITWDPAMRATFESYRDYVSQIRGISKKKAEVKRFRSEARACLLGEGGNMQLCMLPMGDCRLCTAICTGFVYSLNSKRNAVLLGKEKGVRFGGGLYMARSSTKAYEYAKNEKNGSHLKAVLMARVVLGNPEKMKKENHRKLAPKDGCDSVEASPDDKPTELITYHENAARPAYLLLVE